MSCRGILLVLCALVAFAVGYRGMGSGQYHGNRGGESGHQHFYGPVYHNHHHGGQGSYHGNNPHKYHHQNRDSSAENNDDDDDNVWHFQIGDSYGAYEYIGDDGYLKGFHIDLLLAVCKQAGKRCHYVMDLYSNCWNAAKGIEHPGVGILDGWYEGCVGYFPTPMRLNSLNFTDPFTKRFQASLYVKADAQIEDPKDLSGWNIGFVEGWSANQRCVSRQKLSFKGVMPPASPAFNALYFQTHDELILALATDKVKAILTEEAFGASQLGLKALEPSFFCSNGGSAIMTRYGSGILGWWNEAFNDFVQSGKYSQLCTEAKRQHGDKGPIHCIE